MSQTIKPDQLRPMIIGLMLADHLGDVADEIHELCKLAKLPKPNGNYHAGWGIDWDSQTWESDTPQ